MNGEKNGTVSIGSSDGRHGACRKGNARKLSGQAPDAGRTVVYARSRTAGDIARQVEAGKAYAVRVLGVDPDAIVVLSDHGGAMGPDRGRRPGVEGLISRIAEFDRIIVEDPDRLYRDPTALYNLSRLLRDTGCELHIFTSGPMVTDAMSISGCMTASMAGSRKRMSRIAPGPRGS